MAWVSCRRNDEVCVEVMQEGGSKVPGGVVFWFLALRRHGTLPVRSVEMKLTDQTRGVIPTVCSVWLRALCPVLGGCLSSLLTRALWIVMEYSMTQREGKIRVAPVAKGERKGGSKQEVGSESPALKHAYSLADDQTAVWFLMGYSILRNICFCLALK